MSEGRDSPRHVLDPAEVRAARFAVARAGFDPPDVLAYLNEIAAALAHARAACSCGALTGAGTPPPTSTPDGPASSS